MGSPPRALRFGALTLLSALLTAACGLSVVGSAGSAGADGGAPVVPGVDGSVPSSNGGDPATGGGDSGASDAATTSDSATPGCTIDCLGGACVGGRCQPTLLASNETGARGMTATATDLLWTRDSGDAVRKKPLAGGDVTTVITKLQYMGAPEDLASNGAQIFVTQRGTGRLSRYEANGSWSWTMSPFTTPTGIGMAGDRVYWTAQQEDGVASIDVNHNGYNTRPAQNWPSDVFVVGATMYFACSSGILSAPAASGTPQTMLSPVTRWGLDAGADLIHNGIAVIDATIYFTIAERGIVASVPITGGSATVLADKQRSPVGIAASTNAVFWANNGDGTIMKLAR